MSDKSDKKRGNGIWIGIGVGVGVVVLGAVAFAAGGSSAPAPDPTPQPLPVPPVYVPPPAPAPAKGVDLQGIASVLSAAAPLVTALEGQNQPPPWTETAPPPTPPADPNAAAQAAANAKAQVMYDSGFTDGVIGGTAPPPNLHGARLDQLAYNAGWTRKESGGSRQTVIITPAGDDIAVSG